MPTRRHKGDHGPTGRARLLAPLRRIGLRTRVALLLAATLWIGWWLAVRHVYHMTGRRDISANCYPCHVARPRALARGMKGYFTPVAIAVTPDGSKALVAGRDANALARVDLATGRVMGRLSVGAGPHGIAVTRSGRTAYVSCRRSDSIAVLDLDTSEVSATFPTGMDPCGIALDGDERTLYVANSLSDDISVIDVASGRELKRLAAGREPYAACASPDGSRILVANRLTNRVPYGAPPVSEITVIDTGRRRVLARPMLRGAHMAEDVAYVPRSGHVLSAVVRPRNLLPATQIAQGWVMVTALAIADPSVPGQVTQLPLDDMNRYYADPSGIAVAPNGRLAFVSHSGADCITVIDLERARRLVDRTPLADRDRLADDLALSREYIRARIPVGTCPKAMALTPDGLTLCVANMLDDTLTLIDTERLVVDRVVELGEARPVSLLRRGERVFSDAGHSYQGKLSCRSCHPDGRLDGLTYDLQPDGIGRNILDNRTLIGIRNTQPYKWTGRNASLYVQCGPRFAKWLMRAEPIPFDDLNALVTYIESLEPHRRPPGSKMGGELTPAQRRGKALFGRTTTNDGRAIALGDRCDTCHVGPRFTDGLSHDVGSAAPTDTVTEFDTPHLPGIRFSGPYLHDGRAGSLEGIWTLHNPEDRHGVTNDMRKDELNDLVEYLRSL